MKSEIIGIKGKNYRYMTPRELFSDNIYYDDYIYNGVLKGSNSCLTKRGRQRGIAKKRERSRERSRESIEENEEFKIKEKTIEKNNLREKNTKKKPKKDLNLENKDEVMKIIYTQNFIKGFWNENEETKIIIEKYRKEYNLIKKLKNKKIDDKVAITIIIIYFIHKEYPGLLTELSRIIKKAKIFIAKSLNISYENVLKEIGIN